MEKKKEKHRRMLAWVLFAVYMILLMYFLFFAEITGRNCVDRNYNYNLIPLREIRRFIVYRKKLGWFPVFANLLGNVVAFVPFGMILPMLLKRCRNFFYTVLLSLEFSLFVEIIQLVSKVGSFDVDDLLLNTLGGALGFCSYLLIRNVRRKKIEKKGTL